MKNLILVTNLLMLPSYFAMGQEYPMIDTLNFGLNVKEAYKYATDFNDIDTIIAEKYIFNKNGQHVITYAGYNWETQHRIIYKYADTNLKTIQRHEYISTKNDSIRNKYFEEFDRIIDSIGFENYDWNLLHEKYSKLYDNIDPEQVEWENATLESTIDINYNEKGKPSIINIHSGYNQYLDYSIFLIYNSYGKLEKKISKDIPHDNVFKFQAFKSNSAILDDSIRNLSGDTLEKRYQYFQDSTVINYYLNNQLTGFEFQVFDPITMIKTYVITNIKGDTLSAFKEEYDNRNLLINRKRLLHTGYNGFGYSTDLGSIDEEKYIYDNKGILTSIEYKDDTHSDNIGFKIHKMW